MSKIILLVVILAVTQNLIASPATQPALQSMSWEVEGVTRKALVYLPPDSSDSSPIVFAFHGHGGRSELAVKQFAFHKSWPEAICVYPQGLPTKTAIDPEGKFPGWQKNPGDDDDRDLKFFDAMLKTFTAEHHGDPKHVFISGHSNGAFFTYVVLSSRSDAICAIAPIAGLLTAKEMTTAKPKPIFHVAGQKDPMVKFDLQQETIQEDLKLDGCKPAGEQEGEYVTQYSSDSGPTVITFIHPGGHEIPPGVTKQIAEFFKSQK